MKTGISASIPVQVPPDIKSLTRSTHQKHTSTFKRRRRVKMSLQCRQIFLLFFIPKWNTGHCSYILDCDPKGCSKYPAVHRQGFLKCGRSPGSNVIVCCLCGSATPAILFTYRRRVHFKLYSF